MIVPLLLVSLVASTYSLEPKPLNCLTSDKQGSTRSNLERQERNKFDEFDWDLSKAINALEKGNIVISPISLKVVLAMLHEGAKGKTAQELREALSLDNTNSTYRKSSRDRFSCILNSLQTSKGEYKIKIGTHVFIDESAEPQELFKNKIKQYYNSDMEKVNFSDTAQAVKTINNWAKTVTDGHIQDLISEAEAHSSTIMLLLNAVYFKGLWEIPFPENQTKPGLFHLNDKESVEVPLMNTTEKFLYYDLSDVNAQLLKLPYLGGKFAMYILLPNTNTELNKLAEAFGPQKPLINYIQNMTMTTVHVVMPKFEFDFTTSLRDSLEKLNITRMFTSEAELTDIAKTRSGSLVVSNVLQKAGISVTEIGTVAYAATVVDLMDKFGGEEEVVQFKADRPFIFFIQDEFERTTVFVGKVTNPATAKVVTNSQTTSSPVVTPVTAKPTESSKPNESPVTKPSESMAGAPTADPLSQCAGTLCSAERNRFGNDEEAKQTRLNFFDAELLKEVGNKEPENFVISPVSIKTLLGLVMEGAEGSTLEELQTVLRLPQNITSARRALSDFSAVLQKSHSSNVTVDAINQAYFSNEITPNTTYVKSIKDYYKTGVDYADFSSPDTAANQINSWVLSHTRGLISDLISPEMIHSNTYSILISAIYFDGRWKTEFNPQDTQEMCFYSHPYKCQRVPMMYKNEELYYKFDLALDSHVLQIPYEDNNYFMVVVLPRETGGMKQLSLDANRLSFPRLLENLHLFEVNLKMPRFTIEYRTDVITILKKMGLEQVFSADANLPNMVNKKQGRVGALVHKAKIEVSENGTRAAAASGASVVPLMYGLDVIDLVLNHPFYYFVCEGLTNTVLFAGRLSSLERPTISLQKGVPYGLEPLNVPSRPNIPALQNHQYDTSSTTSRRYKNTQESLVYPRLKQ